MVRRGLHGKTFQACSHGNALDVQPRTRDRSASGLKFPVARATSPMSPSSSTVNSRSTHESTGGESKESFTSELLDGLDVAASYSYRQESGPRAKRNFTPALFHFHPASTSFLPLPTRWNSE